MEDQLISARYNHRPISQHELIEPSNDASGVTEINWTLTLISID